MLYDKKNYLHWFWLSTTYFHFGETAHSVHVEFVDFSLQLLEKITNLEQF
jgi:hypothetical protein